MEAFLGFLFLMVLVVGPIIYIIWPFVKFHKEDAKEKHHKERIDQVEALKQKFPDAYREWFGTEWIGGLSDSELDHRRTSHQYYEWVAKQNEYDEKKEAERKQKEEKQNTLAKANALCTLYPNACGEILGRPLLYDSSNSAAGNNAKDTQNTYSLSNSDIDKLLAIPGETLRKTENKIVAERKRLQDEVDRKYAELEAQFPNGIRIYKQQYPSVAEKEQLVAVSKEVFQDYEQNYHISQYYSEWHGAQVRFAQDVRNLRDSILKKWGCYSYTVCVHGYDELGERKDYDFKVWQLFCEDFCTSQTVDYTNLPSCKTNFERIPELFNKERHYNDWVYDQIVEFIEALPGEPLVNFADSGLVDSWVDIDGYHFGYLKQKLAEKSIPFVSVDHLPPEDPLHNGPVVFIELVSNNDRLRNNCLHFLESSSGNNITVVYVSLLKELDEEEFARRNTRKEKEIQERIERERREQEEQERREREETERLEREERARLERERQERLYRVSHNRKPNASAIINYLTSSGIHYLYHFTDRRNLDSIRTHGGLFSWKYCVDNGIEIPYPGGDEQSRQLDRRHGLADYVRLSFCNDHPMRFVVDNRGGNTVLLRIKIDVAGLEGTLFSDINAADNDHHHGGTLEDLRRVNLSATQQNFVSRESDIFKQHQAEVLVKTFIPLEYIVFPEESSSNWGILNQRQLGSPSITPLRPIRDDDPLDDLPF